jgi:hypothetical protein
MEHLMPPGRVSPPFVIPYFHYNQYGYAISMFYEYPADRGWNVSNWIEDEKIYLGERSLEDLPGFLQSWLYFGFLAAILDIEVPLEDFLRFDEGNRCVLTTEQLPKYLAEWKVRTKDISVHDKAEMFQTRRIMFDVSWKVRDNLIRYAETLSPSPKKEALLEALLGIWLLNDALSGASIKILMLRTYWRGQDYQDCRNPMLRSKMLRGGWCPRLMHVLQRSLDTELQAYLFALGSERTKEDHTSCSTTVCVNCQIGPSYRVRHTNPGCDCNILGVPEAEIAAIISRGQIPILRVTQHRDSSPFSFEIKGYDRGDKYIAVSHVWADGLGNPSGNTVPYCQVTYLQSVLLDAWFWFDTLCIPVSSEFHDFRDFSISKMSDIYRNAYGVLVLDKDLQTLPDGTPTTELLMRFATSNWRQRLWTYQEGFLADKLFIRGRDCTFILRNVAGYHIVTVEGSPVLQHSIDPKVLHEMVSVLLNDGLRDRKVDGPLSKQFGLGAQRLLVGISDRCTSRAGDETICIATALNIDPSPLLPLPAEERMIRLLQLMPSIPMNIIFAGCPRFDVPCFSWAPKSLLESGGPEGGNHCIIYRDASRLTIEGARLTEHGLCLSLPGLDVDPSLIIPRNIISSPSQTDPNRQKAWLINWKENTFKADILSIFHDKTMHDIAPPNYVKYALILGIWDFNAVILPALLVAWNDDRFDEEGARIVQPIALAEVLNLKRSKTVLMDHLKTEGEEQPTSFPERKWCLR